MGRQTDEEVLIRNKNRPESRIEGDGDNTPRTTRMSARGRIPNDSDTAITQETWQNT